MRRALALAGILLVAVGAAGWSWWRSATALPEWYLEELSAEDGGADADASAPRPEPGGLVVPMGEAPAAWAPPSDSDEPSRARAKRAQMKNFHLRARVASPAARKAFRASRATFDDGRLEAGVVIDLARLPRDELSAKDRRFYDRVRRSFPALTDRAVYVALHDQPRVREDGILQLGSNPKVRVGELSYSLDSVAKKLGLPPETVRRDLNRELRRMKVTHPDHLPRAPP